MEGGGDVGLGASPVPHACGAYRLIAVCRHATAHRVDALRASLALSSFVVHPLGGLRLAPHLCEVVPTLSATRVPWVGAKKRIGMVP